MRRPKGTADLLMASAAVLYMTVCIVAPPLMLLP